MSAAVLWIFIPAFLGLAAIFARRLGPVLYLILAGVSLLLTWLAWQIPIDLAVDAGSTSFKIVSSFSILGRSLALTDLQRPLIAFVYLANALWLLGAYLASPGSLFAGISQISVALFMAALSVDPFLYAAIFIALIVLASVLMLASPGKPINRGLVRYVSMQLFGIPFILFVGWMLAGIEASPGSSDLVLRAGTMLVLGFAFLLAIFPFHSWLPMLAQEAHPYPFAFLVFFLPFASSLFALAFFERYAWIRDNPNLDTNLILIGSVITLIGGVWAFIQSDVRRQMGYLVVFQTGTWLAAIGLYSREGLSVFFALAWAHLFAMILWAIAISGLSLANNGNLTLAELSRITHRHPILVFSLLLSLASFGALPLSFSFFPRLELVRSVFEISKLSLAVLLAGTLFVVLTFLKNLHILAAPLLFKGWRKEDESLLGKARDALVPDRENSLALIFLGIVALIFIVFAFFPSAVFAEIPALSFPFPQLAP